MTWKPEIDELGRRIDMAAELGGPEGIARQRSRGKLTVRERLALLVDRGTFQEFEPCGARAPTTPTGASRSSAPRAKSTAWAASRAARWW
jgi:acetyl-CoA carboxylase carboxyltransferase component